MKYQWAGEVIPQEARKDLNDKIIYLVDNALAESEGITKEDIYNAYTGNGGLHGLNVKDFDNFHQYSEAKKEFEQGQFFTPDSVCRMVVESLHIGENELVADLTCGMGRFFNFCPTEQNTFGCEIDLNAYKVAHYLFPAANLERKDIRNYYPAMKMDYVIGNPPFNLAWRVDGQEVVSQLCYCQKAAEVLKPMGIMAIVVPASFLQDDFMDGGAIKELEDRFNFLGQVALKKDTFQDLGVKSFPTKVQFWQRKSEEDSSTTPYNTGYLFPTPAETDDAERIYSMVIAEAQERLRKHRSHILLELARNEDDPSGFTYQCRKMLYAISVHPALKDKHTKCLEQIAKLHTAKKPDDMSQEEWDRVKPTQKKVLAYLRRVLRRQNAIAPKDEIHLVKRDHSIAKKAYSVKMGRKLSDEEKEGKKLFEIVRDGDNPEQYGPYARMIRRRQKSYQTEQMPLSKMSQDPEIYNYLTSFTLYSKERKEWIFFNDLQKHDINLMIQKKYGLLQWEQGSGKTLAGIAISQYRMRYGGAYCTWVVSNAISIKNNWAVVLPDYGIPFVLVKRLKDLEQIKPGDFCLITLNMLTTYRKQIKKWVRVHGQKIALCLDESDEITGQNSKRTKAVLDVFRRCKYKLQTTGTMTRNNICESATALELAYNNSENMLSWAGALYRRNREKELEPVENEYYGKPIPAYKQGYRLFSDSHLPEKITVFGIGEKTQDIYNAPVLNDILDRFVITRTFEEVSGKRIKKIHQILVNFSEPESRVYKKAISEFEEMRSNYFKSTGNARKDSMMRLIQQITMLLRISAAPNTVEEYDGGTPTKVEKVLSMLEEMNDEIVVIGVRHKNVLRVYEEAIKARMPGRKLFIVTGDSMTLKARKELKEPLRKSRNGILLCTQQSLSSSVNFEFVNRVIIPELHYNNAAMSQFYFRFIRYTSTHTKDIYFVTYAGSIESNQMQMVLAKEKLNQFMKGRDVDLDQVYEDFGVDYDLLSLLMSREQDKDGHFHIRWGEQTIG